MKSAPQGKGSFGGSGAITKPANFCSSENYNLLDDNGDGGVNGDDNDDVDVDVNDDDDGGGGDFTVTMMILMLILMMIVIKMMTFMMLMMKVLMGMVVAVSARGWFASCLPLKDHLAGKDTSIIISDLSCHHLNIRYRFAFMTDTGLTSNIHSHGRRKNS